MIEADIELTQSMFPVQLQRALLGGFGSLELLYRCGLLPVPCWWNTIYFSVK